MVSIIYCRCSTKLYLYCILNRSNFIKNLSKMAKLHLIIQNKYCLPINLFFDNLYQNINFGIVGTVMRAVSLKMRQNLNFLKIFNQANLSNNFTLFCSIGPLIGIRLFTGLVIANCATYVVNLDTPSSPVSTWFMNAPNVIFGCAPTLIKDGTHTVLISLILHHEAPQTLKNQTF